MKFSRTFVLTLAAAAMLSSCGSSTDPTNAAPSLDTTPPPAPSGLRVSSAGAYKMVEWSASPAADLSRYQVYVYSPDPTRDNAYTLLGETSATSYTVSEDMSVDGVVVVRLRAVDTAGNRSALSAAIESGMSGSSNPGPGEVLPSGPQRELEP